MLNAYMSTAGGVVATPTSSLVTGYDFMTSGADAVEANLSAGLGPGARNDTLITNDGVSPERHRRAADAFLDRQPAGDLAAGLAPRPDLPRRPLQCEQHARR